MNTSPAPDEREGIQQRELANRGEVTLTAAPSWGERLLPYLFAAIETCWIDAILLGLASINSLPSTPIVPLWSPFVFIAGLYWITVNRERPAAGTNASSSSTILVDAVLVIALFVTLWSGIYASTFALLNPTWLAAILNDLLLLNGNAFHIVFLLLILAYFSWRGVRLSRNALEPGSVSTTLRIGLFLLLAVILLRALNGSQANELALLILVPLFLAFILIAHSFAQATLLRRSHPSGLQGSIHAQENSLLSIIATIGLILLLLSLLIGAIASPAFIAQVRVLLTPIAIAYDWFARAIAFIATLLLTPLIWLFQALHAHPSLPSVKRPQLPPSAVTKVDAKATNTPVIALLAQIIEIALPILIVLLILLVIHVILKRRHIRLLRRQEDQHESLWSWSLFWTQVQAFLKHFFSRFFPMHRTPGQLLMEEELTGEPTARSIREIYRALLRWSAAQGIARKRTETPYEFRTRLDKRLPLTEPELSIVTEAYTATRYGDAVPNEDDVARVKEAWMQLQQKQRSS